MQIVSFVLLSESAVGLQEKLTRLEENCANWCLNVYINKTKILVFNKAGWIIKPKLIFFKITLLNVLHHTAI